MTFFSVDPTSPYFQIFSFIGFVISLIPLPWHFQAWNAGTCAFMIWTATTCLVQFINSIIWSDNVNNIAPVWCDISSQIILCAGVGIPASALCISRRLYTITSVRTVSITHADKRKAVIGDLCVAVGVPAVVVILHTIVQPHRFDILQGVGCYPPTYNTLPAYFLYFMWPTLLGLISFTYSAMTLRSFWIRRAQFSQLVSTNNAMSVSRYFRLMLLACVDMMCTVPLSVYVIYVGRGTKLQPWISWDDTHFDYGRIDQVPALIWVNTVGTSIELARWLCVFSAFIFFALFGFASEARRHYSLVFWWVMKRFGVNRPIKKKVPPSLPSWVATPKSPVAASPVSASPPLYASEHVNLTSSEMTMKSLDDLHMKDVEHSAGLSSPPPVYDSAPMDDGFSFRPSKSWVSFTEVSEPLTSIHHDRFSTYSVQTLSDEASTSHRISIPECYDYPRAI